VNFSASQFLSKVPSLWKEIFHTLQSEGHVPILVGGCVRDFFLQGSLGKDWDIEVTHPQASFEKKNWEELARKLSRLGQVAILPFEVIRLVVADYQFEFSPPRKEKYPEGWQGRGHSHLNVEFDFQHPFSQSVLRRDFTVNAMGIRFLSLTQIEFLDPRGGLNHLEKRQLEACGDDFIKDPVRFLRALRFSLNHSSLQDWPNLKLPITPDAATKKEVIKKVLIQPYLQESWVLALEWAGVSSSGWQQYFSLSIEKSQAIVRWVRESQRLQGFSPEKINGEFDRIKDRPDFLAIFEWFNATRQLAQKSPDLPLLKIIQDHLPFWIKLFQLPLSKDLQSIDPPLRARYQVWDLCQRL
jgi:hypothetical protein